MSGGSHDYAYLKVMANPELLVKMTTEVSPSLIEFVSGAMRTFEWVASGDTREADGKNEVWALLAKYMEEWKL